MTVGTAPTCGPPTGNPQSLQEMDVETFSKMSQAQRLAWYTQMLMPYDAQVRRSASCNGVPSQLVATVILNELADINWIDVWQQRLGFNGSLGIGQIQIDTAMDHGLVSYPGDQQTIQNRAQQAWKLCHTLPMDPGVPRICPSISTYENMYEREMVRHRLTIPEHAIEGAAREIRRILDQACANRSNPWPSRFKFTLASMTLLSQPNDVYNYIDGGNPIAKEAKLAEMVIAAYNSPDIMIAQKQASITKGDPNQVYTNGMIHGANSILIVAELFANNLFR